MREPPPVRPGGPAERDAGYARGGVAGLSMAFEPLVGVRHVRVTERKTSVDSARFLRAPGGEHHPATERVVLVCGNPSTHTPAASYEASTPAEARRLAARSEWHYAPEHGSWLDVAGMELGVLARQCPGRRVPDPAAPTREVAARERGRNATVVKVKWQFTAADARVELKRLYPTIQLR